MSTSTKPDQADGATPDPEDVDLDSAELEADEVTDLDADADAADDADEKKTPRPRTGGAKMFGGADKGKRPSAGGKKGGKRPIKAVKVRAERPWGLIAMFTAVAIVFVSVVGYTFWKAQWDTMAWDKKLDKIDGVVDYRKKSPALLLRNHKQGKQTYFTSPPVGGDHNPVWQDCTGKVYTEAIANEHAVHSMEHGAVWVAYRPDLSSSQVKALAKKVRGKGFVMMSPYPGLNKAVSLQAWGYQLKVDSTGDGRIDDFIEAAAQNATVEPQATCSDGITLTGTEPRNIGGS